MLDKDNSRQRISLRASIAALRMKVLQVALLPNLSEEESQTLRRQVYEDSQLTSGYLLMCGISAGIATLGLLQSSTAVVIGAMLVSPLMTPIVALGFALASLDGNRIRIEAQVVGGGALVGIIVGLILTWLSPIDNATTEIVARTQPTLLDLAVALLSGLAGGYAIVQQRGATAIGVAIATALMPPLAVVGYGLGVARFDFALGAFLLFLTNLAAIGLAIALIARLSGAAKPLSKVDLTPRYAVIVMVVFAGLMIPLGITLVRLAHEADARNAARDTLMSELGVDGRNIAQLDVSWPWRGHPRIDAIVIAPEFRNDAQPVVLAQLTERLGIQPELNLQQVVATDVRGQTRAMVDAAMERTAAGISRDVPPFSEIRASLGVPVQSLWTNRAERIVNIVPVAAPGWQLSDYRDIEQTVATSAGGWQIRVVPPVSATIAAGSGVDAEETALAVWAIKRWGLRSVELTMPLDGRTREEAQVELDKVVSAFSAAQIELRTRIMEGRGAATIAVFGPSPSQLRAQQVAETGSTSGP